MILDIKNLKGKEEEFMGIGVVELFNSLILYIFLCYKRRIKMFCMVLKD